MADIPTKIFNSTVKDQVQFDRYSVGLSKKIQSLLNDAQSEIVVSIAKNDPTSPSMTKWKQARLEKLNEDISTIVNSTFKDIKKLSKSELTSLGNTQAERVTSSLNKSIGADIFSVTLTPEGVKSIVENTLVDGKIIGDWWDKQSEATKAKLQSAMAAGTQAIQIGLIQGESVNDLIGRIRGTKLTPGIMSLTKREAAALVRTSVMQVANDVRMETYKENADVLNGFEFIATLDSRTCQRCRPYDRKQYDMQGNPIGHDLAFPGTPLHFNCRCTTCPTTKSYAELAGKNSTLKQKQLKEMEANIPVGERQTMGKSIPDNLDYNGWLKTQSIETQKDILGQGKWKLWNENKLDAVDLVANNGRPLTLKELQASMGIEQAEKEVVKKTIDEWEKYLLEIKPDSIESKLIKDLDFIGLGIKQKIDLVKSNVIREEGISYVQTIGKEKAIEASFIYDDFGEEIFKKIGEKRGVSFTDEEMIKMKGKVLVHNHPNSLENSLSLPDLNITAKAGLKEIVAVSKEGTRYIASVPKEISAGVYENISNEIKNIISKEISFENISIEDANMIHYHIVNEVLSQNGYIKYRVEKRSDLFDLLVKSNNKIINKILNDFK